MKDYQVTSTTVLAGFPVWWALALIMAVTAYYRLALFFLLATLFLLYFCWSYVWTTGSCRYLTGETIVPVPNLFAGEPVTREVRFSNGWLFPVVRCGVSFTLPGFFAVDYRDDQVALSGENIQNTDEACEGRVLLPWKQYSAHFAWLKEKKEIRLPFTVKPELRGLYYLPPLQLFVGDPSGLYHGTKELVKGHYVYVFPKPASGEEVAKALALADHQLDAGYGLEDRYDIQGVRPYQIADPPKSINWYATARTGSLKSNMYVRKNALRCLIVFDASVYQQPYDQARVTRSKDSKLEEAISFVAGLALFQLEQGAQTAFYTNLPRLKWAEAAGEKKGSLPYLQRLRTITTLDYGEGEEQARRILEICATLDDTGRATSSQQAELWSKVESAAPGAVVYVVTYHLPPAGWVPNKELLQKVSAEPWQFYTPDRVSGLPAAGVYLINLTEGATR